MPRSGSRLSCSRGDPLPVQPDGYYTESDVWPGPGPRGARWVVVGKNAEAWYSPDHYGTFRRLMTSSNWIDFVSILPLVGKGAPYLVRGRHLEGASRKLAGRGAVVGSLFLGQVENTDDLFPQLRAVLTFPDWCGSNLELI